MTPTTVYRGHEIRWSDNEDCWTCWDLSDKARSSPKLSTIKAAIDRLYLAERKANSIPCYELSFSGELVEGNVVEYWNRTERPRWPATEPSIVHKLAVVAKRNGNLSDRPSRAEKGLEDLAPATPEAQAAWARYAEAKRVVKDAEENAHKAFKAIPRLQLTDVQPLVDLYERDLTPKETL